MSPTLKAFICKRTQLPAEPVRRACDLLEQGCTIPYIARYRREQIRGLTEEDLFTIAEEQTAFEALSKRRRTIEKALRDTNVADTAVLRKIGQATTLTELEDLYAPFKKSSATKADTAAKAGLTALAEHIGTYHGADKNSWKEQVDFAAAAKHGFRTSAEIFGGAQEILTARLRTSSALREWVRTAMHTHGYLTATTARGCTDQQKLTHYKNYLHYRQKISRIKPHTAMALLRGEREKILSLSVEIDESRALRRIMQEFPRRSIYKTIHQTAAEEALKKSLLRTGKTQILAQLREHAQQQGADIFARNTEHLLLAAPAGPVPVMAVDPGFTSGSKVVFLGPGGDLRAKAIIFVLSRQSSHTLQDMLSLMEEHRPALLCVGNGTASRETMDLFRREIIPRCSFSLQMLRVSESGASVYSASSAARQEFPDLDISYRGAVSIGRRVQDPLPELIKIDPASIGAGQYQHDIPASLLRRHLDRRTEAAVNRVGADLNRASVQLLARISGITPKTAAAIVAHRQKHGPYRRRRDIGQVAGIGPKTVEQAHGFLRIPESPDPVENSAIHDEARPLLKKIAAAAECAETELWHNRTVLSRLVAAELSDESFGPETVEQVLQELAAPGRDPRRSFRPPRLRDDIRSIADIREETELEGTVENVTDFGAFVDLGIKDSGFIHISQLRDSFVSHPLEVLSPGDGVRVRVLSCETKRHRIGLQLTAVLG
ncbi:MAG: helix-hairpin-helix domain-containing protein [Fibrobacterota bacterium]